MTSSLLRNNFSNWLPLFRYIGPQIYVFLSIAKSFGTTDPWLHTHLLTPIRWRHHWWRHHDKSRKSYFSLTFSTFYQNMLVTSILFVFFEFYHRSSVHNDDFEQFAVKFPKIKQNLKNFKNPRWRPFWIFCICYQGNSG